MKQKIVNIIGQIGSIILFLVLVSSLIKNIQRIENGKELVRKNESKLEKIRQENARLAEQLIKVESDQYIERELRNKLGLIKEGEIIVVLPEAEIVKSLSPQIPEEEEEDPKPNWKKWLDLFNQ